MKTKTKTAQAARAAGAASSPRRRRASSSARRLRSSSWRRRSSSSRLRASAASRSRASRASRSARRFASSSCWRRSSSSRRRASASALRRASRSWSESVRKTTPERGAFDGAPRCARWPCWAGEACAAFAAGAACATGFSSLPPPGPTARRLTVSTTTAFERPCEKLWRTMPCSTGRFRDSVLGDTCNVLSPGFFVSFIPLRSCGFYQIIGSRAPPRGSL